MFFSGTLQEGISRALEQSKNVVCFVTDEGDESQQWEDEFLAETTVKATLDSHAVALRLKAGSEEAGYLEALFPVPRKPTLIVIQNGQLREYIASGTSKDEFTKRLRSALGSSSQAVSTGSAPASSSAPQHLSQPATGTGGDLYDDPPLVHGNDDDLYDAPPPVASSSRQPPAASPASGVPTPSSSEERQPEVQSLLSERARRLEAEKQAKEKAAKAEREKRAKERQEAANHGNEGQSSNATAAMSSHAQMMRKKRQEAKEERQRILRRIEDDKRERREREAQEKQARLLLAATNPDAAASSSNAAASPTIPLPTRGGGLTCNLQVRLFDGSTLRGRFSSDQTLGKEVRQWIDENRADGTDPYTFRVVLTPLPNKVIEPAEESEMLRDIGLAPSATLVLVPVIRVATAYEQGGGLLLRGWSYIYALIAMLFSPFAMLFRGRNHANHDASHENIALDDMDADGSSRQRFRGFRNPDDERRDQQLYNGNSLNFEPRRDHDDESDT
ncbi:UBX domain-containing protein 4 [Apiospora rasikravindrae]|uniref:UBX domain-containing protein 2 n=1 Tax=Apiospora rasikravindrae TaxID=990691 RepID=A0ABR1RMT9_9PEZI